MSAAVPHQVNQQGLRYLRSQREGERPFSFGLIDMNFVGAPINVTQLQAGDVAAAKAICNKLAAYRFGNSIPMAPPLASRGIGVAHEPMQLCAASYLG
jgi:hypothetical protein